MDQIKPKVFVGSSSEAKPLATAFCKVLKDTAIMVPWWLADEFQIMHSILDGLINACDQYDFGLFILTPDDKLESRGVKGRSARDNVMFELGLFLGKLGPNRTLAVIQQASTKRAQVKVPSDLAGIVIPRFEAGDAHLLIASVHHAAENIRQVIEREGRRHGRIGNLVKSWGYDSTSRTFKMTLSGTALVQNKDKLRDRSLVLVSRIYNEDLAFEDDRKIALSKPRKLSRFSNEDLILRASGQKVFTHIQEGDRMEGYLILTPATFNLSKIKTIGEMLTRGCEFLAGRGAKARLNLGR